MDKTILFSLTYGLYIIGVPKSSDGYSGCVVNTVMQVTSEGPDVAVCMSRDNWTYGLIEKAGRFSVSVLSEKTAPVVISRFGFASGRDTEKMEGIRYSVKSGLPLIEEDCCAHLLCEVTGRLELSTHVLLTARVTDLVPGEKETPMTYSFYHSVIKGRASKNAPTYQAMEAAGKYVCDVCGYVYEGDFEKTPDDYKCPICGVDRAHFKRRGE